MEFSIVKTIKKECEEFASQKLVLAKPKGQSSLRWLKKVSSDGYTYNQADTINIIDLYHNSKFESGQMDKQGKRKIFLNVVKFRTDVSAKQIDLDTKDFKFIPEDYASTWGAIFANKKFREWIRENDIAGNQTFGELLNQIVENYPKYGSVVVKKVGKKLAFVPLQTLKNQQDAESLQTAKFVIEEHPDMYPWEIKEMKGWKTDGLDLEYDKCITVYERYGYVPLSFIKAHNGEEIMEGDDDNYVDAMVICTYDPKAKKDATDGEHIFFAKQITERPYRELHWSKQFGRWLGLGVVEDLVENQQAANIIVNIKKRGLEWASKHIFQSRDQSVAAKNLVRDAEDGDVLEVGPTGELSQVDVVSRSNAEFDSFLQTFEHNADQKAFTYEVATGASLPSGTPYSLGVLLSNTANNFFDLKREKLGLFLQKAIEQLIIPQFLKEFSSEEQIINMFEDEEGYEVLRQAGMDVVKTEAIRESLLSGNPVDISTLESAIQPFDGITHLIFKLPPGYFEKLAYKFKLVITGENVDVASKLETLRNLHQLFVNAGQTDRAEKVLRAIGALTGEYIERFGSPKAVLPQQPQPTEAKPVTPANGNQPPQGTGR